MNKLAIDMKRDFTQEDLLVANKGIKRCSTSYVIREMQMKTTMRYHYTVIKMAKIHSTDNTKLASEKVTPQEILVIAGGNAKGYSQFERHFGDLLQN